MATKRLLELALKGLEVERRRIDEEMAGIQKQLRGGGIPAAARSYNACTHHMTASAGIDASITS